ncbi:MAG: hypothetical protein U9Q90_04350 [Campylobacterota bacterium]|nr:hypothetical protein [Campylobacterota bacterium]
MYKRKHTKLVHEGKYVAEIEIEIIDNDTGWSPYISLDDAFKLDNIRELLRNGDVSAAKKIAKIYLLKPVAA